MPDARRNLISASVLLLGAIIWLLLAAGNLLLARLPAEATGFVIAFYPPHWAEAKVLDRILRTEGTLIGEWRLLGAYELQSAEAGFSGRLTETGAILVVPAGVIDFMMPTACGALVSGRKAAARRGA